MITLNLLFRWTRRPFKPTCPASSTLEVAQMRTLRAKTSAAALCAMVAASLIPTSSFAGVMSITDRASVSLTTPVDQVHWRSCGYRHHRWHTSWRYAPRYRYGMYTPRVYASAAPVATCGAAYPGCGVYGSAYPTCGGAGYYGYGGDGLLGLGFGGGGLLGLGLGPL